MALRDREGHRALERERYTRAIKSLVRVGRRKRKDPAALHRRVPCQGCAGTEWESYWTSFSFVVE